MMARIVTAYLDLAELRAEEQLSMTMKEWAEQFKGILRLSRKKFWIMREQFLIGLCSNTH